MLRNTDTRWGGVAQAFHWLIAALIVVQGAIGLTMVELGMTPTKVRVFALHKSIGLTILALVLLRLAWRLGQRTPREVPMPAWQLAAARLSHFLLYLLILALPFSGWLFNSAANFPLEWFGVFHVPSLTRGLDPVLKAFALRAHVVLFWTLVGVVAIHVAAALWHHFRQRDDVLRRMLPARRKRRLFRRQGVLP
ncbi:MAG TPA: cytochrome b [Rhodanobacteraceae bacterium]|nr:cytochrome b [Rhodanobacteraceae bacterium]